MIKLIVLVFATIAFLFIAIFDGIAMNGADVLLYICVALTIRSAYALVVKP